MANRGAPESTLRTVTNINAETPNTAVQDIARAGEFIIESSQQAKVIDNLASATMELNTLTNDFQIKNQRSPKQSDQDFANERQAIFDKYGQDISPFFKKEWIAKTADLKRRNDLTNQSWYFSQSYKNSINDINSSMKSHLQMAAIAGQDYGNNDTNDIEAVLDYAMSRQEIASFGDKYVGKDTTDQMLADYEADYIKSFVSGSIETNPVKALELLKEDKIKDNIHPDDFKVLKDSAKQRVLAFDKKKQEKDILEIMTQETGMYQRSLEGDVPLSDLENMFRKYGTSEGAKNALLRMNGYKSGEGEKKLSDTQKLSNQLAIYDSIAKLETMDSISSKDVRSLQDSIFTAVDNKSLSVSQGRKALDELVAPSVAGLEERLKVYQTGNYNPIFTDTGFAAIEEIFDDDIKIDADETGLTKKEVELQNNKNKLAIYQAFEASLEKHSPVSMAEITSLPSQQRKDLYTKAHKDAIRAFKEQQTGIPSRGDESSRQLLNQIQDYKQQQITKRADEIVNKAYETTPDDNNIPSFTSEDELNNAGLEDGQIVILNGVKGIYRK